LGVGRLSFGSSDRLFEKRGVRPGAVTPLAMITGVKHSVHIFIESDLKHCAKLYVHPLVNDRMLEIGLDGLAHFFRTIGVEPIWVAL